MTLQKNRAVSSPAHWDDVEIGDAVQLLKNGRVEHTGRVDNRTADGAVVWVMSAPGRRQLFHVGDGYQLTVADPEGADHAGH
ncbi:hypothetical protein [Pseudarthrobacter sp. S9]|uniref:hypothetical protein n=1 Tax=Pseudarthrobacter sp. S9 TaxID=3418421 RepID=UPI003D02BFDF